MSGSKRRGDNTAPALFPFLAVLLCTIGALVLILVLTVANSHASAKREAEETITDVKDTVDLMHVVSEELEAQREDLKAKVERRRRDLADIEDHIDRLKKSLDKLVDKIERIQSQASNTEKESSDKSLAVQRLKEEIDQKKKELVEEIEKQKKRKPAFAVIPYVGKNGTSRRPVYLECTKDGVVIQPEGLLISMNDLRPPYGPGNPLDAALRVLRLTYQQKDVTFGINQPPYPLLIVRPDGIQSYAMAREAMSGWDDQFGYELVDNEMELKFPPSPAGLKEQLASTVETAKRRQQAIIASMPRRLASSDRDDNWDTIDAANNAQPSGGEIPWNAAPNAPASNSSSQSEWQLVQGMANSQVASAIQRNGGSGTGQAPPTPNPMQSNPSSPLPNHPFALGGADLSGQYIASDGMPQQPGGQPLGSLGPSLQPTNLASTNRPPNEQTSRAEQESRAVGNAQPTDSPSMPGTSSASGNSFATADGGNAASNADGNNSGPNPSGGSNAPPPLGANAFSSGTAMGGGASSLSATGTSASPQSDPSSPQTLSVAMNHQADSPSARAKHVRPEGDLKPISVSAGHGWAASRAEGKATPVTRSIVLIALKDRWLLRSDEDPNKFEWNVTMDAGPQQAGNELATAMRKRVDSWGLSVPGGYWSPTLTIEAANDAQQSVARLERLLEGSGVEIKVVPLTIPQRR